MDDQSPAIAEDEKGGGWIMTFADLMSLLMCFFVLLLSFAEMDLNKFKAIAGSMNLAFGVQREVMASDNPVGTSIIAQEFSPGRPQPTAINEVRQSTMDSNKQTLEFTDEANPSDFDEDGTGSPAALEAAKETAADAAQLIEALAEEVEKGMVQIETAGTKIIIRIRERASFPSGAAHFRTGFLPAIATLRASLENIEGTIVVAGHTDNIPISTARFRSNWELSASRAVSVVHELLDGNTLEPERFVVEGHGDAHPIVPNDSSENRSVNRRVEMIIQQGGDDHMATDEPIAALPLATSKVEPLTGLDGPQITADPAAVTTGSSNAPAVQINP